MLGDGSVLAYSGRFLERDDPSQSLNGSTNSTVEIYTEDRDGVGNMLVCGRLRYTPAAKPVTQRHRLLLRSRPGFSDL